MNAIAQNQICPTGTTRLARACPHQSSNTSGASQAAFSDCPGSDPPDRKTLDRALAWREERLKRIAPDKRPKSLIKTVAFLYRVRALHFPSK